jgi:hypothetical protein
VLKRISLVLTAVALVVVVCALPALAQEEGSEEDITCAEVAENIKRHVTDYAVGKITVAQAASRVAEELDIAIAEGLSCNGPELQDLARTPGAKDVAEILYTQFPTKLSGS